MSRPPDVPQLVVEVAFASDPLASSYTWTDISAYVRSVNGVQVRRGKQTEVETTASSSLSLTLDNRDRRFDPTYASGPYYGNLKPRKPIRVRALWNATYYPVYQGFVDGWPQDYFFRRDASCSITAYDALAIAGQAEIKSFAYDYLGNTIGDLRYYLFTASQNKWMDLRAVEQYAQLQSGVFATTQLGDVEGDGVTFDGDTVYRFFNTPGSNTSFTISFWVQTTKRGTSASVLMDLLYDTTYTVEIGIDSSGRVKYSTTNAQCVSERSVANGRPMFVTIVQNGTAPSIYINGVDDTSVNDYITGSVTEPQIEFIGSNATPTTVATMQALSLSGAALSAAQVSTLYKYSALDALESTASRTGNVLGLLGWPSGLRDLTTHPQVDVREVPTGPITALSELQTVADSEYGRLFVTKDGKVALQDRFWHITSTRGSTTQATFSDDGSDTFYAGTGFDYSDREVANRVTVTGSADISNTAEDSGSKTAYGLQTFSLATYLSTGSEVNSAAAGILSRRKEPILRADAITVKPARQPSSWPTVLGLELGDRIVIEVTPKGVTPQIQRTLLIERLDWSISIDRWELAITGSPVPDESYWLLNTSELDTETVLGW